MHRCYQGVGVKVKDKQAVEKLIFLASKPFFFIV